jgi:hypothetical protein
MVRSENAGVIKLYPLPLSSLTEPEDHAESRAIAAGWKSCAFRQKKMRGISSSRILPQTLSCL